MPMRPGKSPGAALRCGQASRQPSPTDDNIRARNPGYRTAGVNRRSKDEAARPALARQTAIKRCRRQFTLVLRGALTQDRKLHLAHSRCDGERYGLLAGDGRIRRGARPADKYAHGWTLPGNAAQCHAFGNQFILISILTRPARRPARSVRFFGRDSVFVSIRNKIQKADFALGKGSSCNALSWSDRASRGVRGNRSVFSAF
jgi:hypothetical protein